MDNITVTHCVTDDGPDGCLKQTCCLNRLFNGDQLAGELNLCPGVTNSVTNPAKMISTFYFLPGKCHLTSFCITTNPMLIWALNDVRAQYKKNGKRESSRTFVSMVSKGRCCGDRTWNRASLQKSWPHKKLYDVS